MGTIHEIIEYCSEQNVSGALLVTGEWGCGKTYLVEHEILDKGNKAIHDKLVPIRISIFGEPSVAAVNKKIKQAYFMAKSDISNKSAKPIEEIQKGAASVANAIGEFFPLGKAIGSVLSVDFYDFVEVTKEVKDDHELLLIIDDLERTSISYIELLGCLNEYIENKKIKTILVADESKIISDKESDNTRNYKTFKEKIICRTLKHFPEYERIIQAILNDYVERESGYLDFLNHTASTILQVFVCSQTNNIRSIKYGIQDFERIFHMISEKKLDPSITEKIFYSFLAIKFEICSNNYQDDKCNGLLSSDTIGKKYAKYDNRFVLKSYLDWLLTGAWDSEALLLELEQFIPKDSSISIDQKVLYSSLFDLEYSELIEGFPIIIGKAYSGALRLDEYYKLFSLRLDASDCDIQLPVEHIDYEKMLAAVLQKIESIKQGSEPYSRIRFYIDDETIKLLNTGELAIYKAINHYKNFEQHYKNRTFFIEAHRAGDASRVYECEKKYYKAFDNEMCQAVFEYFSHSSNAVKHQYGFSLQNTWGVHSISTRDDLLETRDNIRKLANLIREDNSGDNIGKAINTILIDKLNALENEYEQRIIDVE